MRTLTLMYLGLWIYSLGTYSLGHPFWDVATHSFSLVGTAAVMRTQLLMYLGLGTYSLGTYSLKQPI